jgi:O-antigen/teichoic acid export membrane protein
MRGLLGRHLSDPLFSTSYLLLGASVGASAFGFLFWIVAARTLTQATFASSGAAISAMAFVSGLSATGLAQVLVRFLPGAGTGSAALIRRIYVSSAAIAGVMALIAAETAGTWSPRLDRLASDRLWTVGFVAGAMVLAVFALQDGALTGIGQARWIPFENILYGIVRLALLGALAAGTLSIIVAWWLPALAAVGAVSALLFKRLVPVHAAAGSGDGARAGTFRFAAASLIGSSLGLTAATVTPIIVIASVGARDGARFYAAWTVMAGLTLISVSTATSLTAMGGAEEAEFRAATLRALRQILGLSLVAVALVCVLARPILSLFGAGYGGGAPVLRVLVLSVVPFCVSMLGLSVARVREAVGAILLWEGTLICVALPLGAILVWRHGAMGAAIAWLAAQLIAAVVSVVTGIRPLFAASAAARPRPFATGEPR